MPDIYLMLSSVVINIVLDKVTHLWDTDFELFGVSPL